MSDHLPECDLGRPCPAVRDGHGLLLDGPECPYCEATCICDRLSAAEQRVRESEACLAICADRNYQRGLGKEREAVEALEQEFADEGDPVGRYAIRDALAAIDGIRNGDN